MSIRATRSRCLLLVLLSLLLASCSLPEDANAPDPCSAGCGELVGVVRWTDSDIPEETRVVNATDPKVCGERHSLEDVAISADGGGVRDTIVALTDVPSDKIPAVEHETLVIDNTQCRFVPHAAVATVGSTIEAVNSDSVLHTTHLYGPVESNISLPIEGARAERTFRRPGLVVVKCDIHGWMQAFIRVDEHPFHAVTDDDGVFAIRNIPPGTYTLDVWHERLGRRTESVTILPGETTHVELPFP